MELYVGLYLSEYFKYYLKYDKQAVDYKIPFEEKEE